MTQIDDYSKGIEDGRKMERQWWRERLLDTTMGWDETIHIFQDDLDGILPDTEIAINKSAIATLRDCIRDIDSVITMMNHFDNHNHDNDHDTEIKEPAF